MRTSLILGLCFCLISCENDEPQVQAVAATTKSSMSVVDALMASDFAKAHDLLEDGANPNEVNRFGDAPVHWAAQAGNLEMVRALSDHGADLLRAGTYGKTALHWAARSGSLPLCKYLIQQGAPVDALDQNLNTPLMVASEANREQVVAYLLSKGAALEHTNVENETPIMAAVRGQANKSIQKLVLAGSDLEKISNSGKNVIEQAVANGTHPLFMTAAITDKMPFLAERFEQVYKVVILNEKEKPKLDLKVLSAKIHELVNAERIKQGLNALRYDPKLEQIATGHSTDMGRRNFFDHATPEGLQPVDRARQAQYQVTEQLGNNRWRHGIGENIFKCRTYNSYYSELSGSRKYISYDWFDNEKLAKIAVEGWMNSPGHRSNILGEDYKREGIGIHITADDEVYITQNFF